MSEENNDKKKVGKSVNAGKPDVKGDKREEERRAKMKELLNPIDGTADKNAGPRKPNWRSILLYALILVVVVVAVGSAMQRQANENTVELATSEFVSAVEDGQVSEATYVAMTYTIKGEYWPEADKIGDENALVPFTSTYLGTDSLAELMASHPEVKYVADVSTTPTWVSLLTSMLPMLILIGVMVYFMNKFSDPTGGAMGFGTTKAQTTDATRPKVCFDDVAGCDEAIEELKEIKDYLRGEYGQAPGQVDEDLRKKVLGDEQPVTCRFADLLEPGFERYKAEIGDLAQTEEDVLSYAAFPQVAEAFLQRRKEREERAVRYTIEEL